MTKRILGCLFISVIVVIALSVSAFAADIVDSGYCGGEGDGTNLSWTLDSDGVLTISGTGKMKDNYEPQPWDDYGTDITAIVIEDGVTSIGRFSFVNYHNLKSVDIPDSVTSIGDSAFWGCMWLTSIDIPDSVTSIGDKAFGNCYRLTSVVLPDKITSIGYSVFESCGLTSVVISNSVTSIDGCAFKNCQELTNITIPKNVTSIGDEAFANCSSLTSITVDVDNPVYLGAGNCIIEKATKTLVIGCKNSTIPNDGSVTSIGDWAFAECRTLTSIVIPNTVTSIGKWAFDSAGIQTIYIPSSVTSIGHGAFTSSDLTSIVIPEGVISIGENAFDNCFLLKSVVIPDSVTSIGEEAFRCCNSLTDIVIPSSVTSIPGGMFWGCDSLTSIVIPDSVTSIENGAFGYCTSLASIDIPASVTCIEDNVFVGCSSLTGVIIPNSATSIGERAFEYCTALTSINIPDSVTSIGEWAFYGCSALTDVYYSGTKKEWGKITIGDYNDELLNATIHFEEEDDDEYLLYYEQLMALQNMRFTITATASEGGTVTPAGSTAHRYGTSKTYTFIPDAGYEISSVIIDGKDIGAASEYTFKNIKKNHKISVVFSKTEWVNPFTDVSTADWFYDDVKFVNEQGLMIGTASDKFSPDAALDRATVVTTLWRLAGSPTVESDIAFDDLYDDWYTDAMKWAIANGIILGYGDGTCRPTAEITHEELCAVFKRYTEYAEIEIGTAESIISEYTHSSWAEKDIAWAGGIGLFDEIGSGVSDLTKVATRAEIAAYLRKLCALINP